MSIQEEQVGPSSTGWAGRAHSIPPPDARVIQISEIRKYGKIRNKASLIAVVVGVGGNAEGRKTMNEWGLKHGQIGSSAGAANGL